jgi:hypothetical protein
MSGVLLTAVTLFLFVTLFFPALAKLKNRRILVVYYSELLTMDNGRIRFGLLLTCIFEIILALALLFQLFPVVTGPITIILLLLFLGFHIVVMHKSYGSATCGCDGSTTAISAQENVGALVGTLFLVTAAVGWMILV